MAGFVDDELAGERTPPPDDLREAWDTKAWGLPESGGRLDQPAGLLKRMSVALSVYNACKGFYTAGNIAEWCDRNPDAWRIVENVMELRKHAT